MKLSASLVIASSSALNPSERWERLKYEAIPKTARSSRSTKAENKCTGQYANLKDPIEFLRTWNEDAQSYFNIESEASWAYVSFSSYLEFRYSFYYINRF